MKRPDDICTQPDRLPEQSTTPLAPPIFPSAVWACDDIAQTDRILSGNEPGYVYQRDGHPNADLIAGKCRQLHRAERAAVCSSGMSALALAVLSQLERGDHMVVSHMLYGKSLTLLCSEVRRFGIESTVADLRVPELCTAAIQPQTRLIVAETISNPCLAVADIGTLANIAHRAGAKLLVDNTFATPVLCRPLEFGADLVLESITKLMNGHSDVVLGLLCGSERDWNRVPSVSSAWGFTSSPFDCWLAGRGLSTLHLRVERACDNAMRVAQFLASRQEVAGVDYPGLSSHAQHHLAADQFSGRYGSMVTFHLRGGTPAAQEFINRAKRILFCPSLGDIATTLSHPASTSHRALSERDREALGITGGTIRLSVGVESPEQVLESVADGLGAA